MFPMFINIIIGFCSAYLLIFLHKRNRALGGDGILVIGWLLDELLAQPTQDEALDSWMINTNYSHDNDRSRKNDVDVPDPPLLKDIDELHTAQCADDIRSASQFEKTFVPPYKKSRSRSRLRVRSSTLPLAH